MLPIEIVSAGPSYDYQGMIQVVEPELELAPGNAPRPEFLQGQTDITIYYSQVQ